MQMTQGIQSSDLKAPVVGTTHDDASLLQGQRHGLRRQLPGPDHGHCRRLQQAGRLRPEQRPVSLPLPERKRRIHADHFRSGAAFPAGLPVAGDFDGNATAGR